MILILLISMIMALTILIESMIFGSTESVTFYWVLIGRPVPLMRLSPYSFTVYSRQTNIRYACSYIPLHIVIDCLSNLFLLFLFPKLSVTLYLSPF